MKKEEEIIYGLSSQEMMILRSVLAGKSAEVILEALNKVKPGIFQLTNNINSEKS